MMQNESSGAGAGSEAKVSETGVSETGVSEAKAWPLAADAMPGARATFGDDVEHAKGKAAGTSAAQPSAPSAAPAPRASRPAPERASAIGILTARVAMAFRVGNDDAVRELGLTSLQARTLWVVDAMGGGEAMQKAIAERTGMLPPAVTRLIKALEQRGLLTREISPDDNRRKVLTLTDEGHAVVRHFVAAVKAHDEAMLAPLSTAERDELGRLLSLVHEHAMSSGLVDGRGGEGPPVGPH